MVAVDYSSNTVLNSGRRPPKTSFLRSSTRRKLEDYSSNYNNYNNNNGYNNYNSNSGYNGYNSNNNDDNGGGSYGYNQNSQSNSYQGSYDSGNSYQNNGGYNNQNSYNQDYDNSNYIWANDDAAAAYGSYGNDDNSYFNSNKAYQANAYNGRDQSWGGQSIQWYNDDEEPEIEEAGYLDDDAQWDIVGKLGGLSAAETFAVASLAVFASLSVLFVALLGCGFNIFDLCQLYCCFGLFAHSDETGDVIEDTFVKLGDY